jgi:hypothetical protein
MNTAVESIVNQLLNRATPFQILRESFGLTKLQPDSEAYEHPPHYQ